MIYYIKNITTLDNNQYKIFSTLPKCVKGSEAIITNIPSLDFGLLLDLDTKEHLDLYNRIVHNIDPIEEIIIEEKQEKIINDSRETIEEIKEDESLNRTVEETIKDFEMIDESVRREYQQMEQEVGNNQIYELILSVKKDIYEMKKEDLKIGNAIIKRVNAHTEISSSTNARLNKSLAIFIAVVFLTGVILGTQYQVWSPYIGQLLDFSRTVSNITGK